MGAKGKKLIDRKPGKVDSSNIMNIDGVEYINTKGLVQRYGISPSLVHKRAEEKKVPHKIIAQGLSNTKWYIDNGLDFKRVEPEIRNKTLTDNRHALPTYGELVKVIRSLEMEITKMRMELGELGRLAGLIPFEPSLINGQDVNPVSEGAQQTQE